MAKRKPARRRTRSVPRPPKGARMVRTSERTSFNTCRFAWDLNYRQRLKPIEEAPALKFGTWVHKALELRYPPGVKRGPHPADSFQTIYEDAVDEIEREWGMNIRNADGDWEGMLELGVDMLEGFVEEYGDDEEWEIIAPEMTFQVPVKHPERDQILFWYVGTMDDVRRNRSTGAIRINDYKTTSNDPVKDGQGKTVLDEQATAYWTWGVEWLIDTGVLLPRELQNLDGMLYTFLRKAKKDPRITNDQGQCLNQDGSISKKQPLPRFHRELVYRTDVDRERARKRAYEEFREMVLVEKGLLEPRKTPDTGSMGHCNWCGFRDMCELHEAGADWEGVRDVAMKNWDPYDAHEIEEEGKGR